MGGIYRGSDIAATLVGTWQCHVPTDVSHQIPLSQSLAGITYHEALPDII
ncbi:hypothetical protein NDI37_01050 [Funiculus sociatus GB2-A5]|uniref:Uncharacterized protein n=1 Tax=Funiculus sociatus GB2-A5 TaxID=2933946 RepID=A0ABV0JHY2_9CYAN|nr:MULTISPECIES: hypothetical protein [unclassified Trichocoleus]MBD1904555.1 hypothetical protein [Trichocoleus sp. FACHB-832]MBD2064486.1 hypothetical protein [Trichocoleus sp. FACHB-6]